MDYVDINNVSIIKKGSQYISVSTGDIVFKDILSFTSPCSLEKYLKQWNATAGKGIYPYSHFTCIEDIENCIEFPSYESFFNQLKKV